MLWLQIYLDWEMTESQKVCCSSIKFLLLSKISCLWETKFFFFADHKWREDFVNYFSPTMLWLQVQILI